MVFFQDLVEIKIISATIPHPLTLNETIVDWVDINMEQDFFTPADGIIIELQDTNIQNYLEYMQRGNRVEAYLNNKLNMVGYIFKYELSYDSHGIGSKLRIECKDLLEYMAQGSCPPNLGDSQTLTNFYFPSTASLEDCCKAILGAFSISLASSNPAVGQLYLSVVDNNATHATGTLNSAAGFNMGGRQFGKLGNAKFAKSIKKALNHNNHANKGETYLGFMDRLVKLGGGYINMAPGSDNTIVIQSPTYDRDQPTPYNLYHLLDPANSQNNVLSANLQFNLDHQHNVVVMESSAMNSETFDINLEKIIAINELTAYYINTVPGNTPVMLPSVGGLVGEWAYPRELSNPDSTGPGYYIIPIDERLYNTRINLGIDINSQLSLPLYKDAENTVTALDKDQLMFACAQTMAEIQDKYIVFTYEVDGWTNGGAIWQPNMLVNVYEEYLSPGNPKKLTLWISKVQYIKNRHKTTSKITCHLPYTHKFELTSAVVPEAKAIPKYSYVATYANVRNETITSISNEVLNEQPELPVNDQLIPVPETPLRYIINVIKNILY